MSSQTRGIDCSVRRGLLLTIAAICMAAVPAVAQQPPGNPGRAPGAAPADPHYRNDRVKPFKIIGNIYYVGSSQHLSSFLIATPQGHILIDTGFEESVAADRENIEELGYRITDVKLLLASHAHGDHIGGFTRMKELTGARVITSALDAGVMESGGKTDFRAGETWTPTRPDQQVKEGDKVSLGGTTLVAHITPGHTKGCTTWTTTVEDSGKTYHVVFLCGVRMNDNVPVVNNPKYPNMIQDFESSFKKLKGLPCDVFLGAHGYWFELGAKMEKMGQGGPNPFIDPQGYRKYLDDMESYFREEVRKEGGTL